MRKIKQSLLSCVLTLAIIFGIMLSPGGLTASAAYDGEYDMNSVSSDVTINSSGYYLISGSSSSYKISVSGSITANITLSGANLTSTSGCAFSIASGSTVNLTLIGTNTLTSGGTSAGLSVPSGATLNITSDSTGMVTATGGDNGAGIGGGDATSCGNVTISGGTIVAQGGTFASGIGSGANFSDSVSTFKGGTVTISGGTVTATGKYGAGIGGGYRAGGGSVTISGGTVTATSDYASGIGGGWVSGSNTSTGSCKITGGSVNASIAATPTNGTDTVYLTTVDGLSENDLVYTVDGANPVSCAADSNGKLYLWLPVTESSTTILINISDSYYEASGTVTTGTNSFTASSIAVTEVTGISLSTSSKTFTTIGDTLTLTATFSPTDATDKSIIWSSSDADVATVSSSGVVTAIGDGTATITAKTTNKGYTATCGITVDATAPSGYGVSFDQTALNSTNQNALSFSFSSAEVGATYSYTISSSGGGTPVTGSGTISTATDQITGIDVSGLSDGTLTLSVTLTDAAGNTGNAVTDTIIKDTAAPTITLSTTAGSSTNAPIPVTVTFSESVTGFASDDVTATNGAVSNFSGSGTSYSFNVVPTADGSVTISVAAGSAADAAGNQNTASNTLSLTYDATAPTGYSVSFDQTYINSSNHTAASFAFSAAEVGASYSYTISSSGGGTPVTGSGTISTATDQITGIDVSGLSDGTLTLSVTLTDTAGNTGNAVTDTIIKDTAAPTITLSTTAGSSTNAPIPVTVSFGESVTGFASDDVTATNGAVSNFSGSGTSFTFDVVPTAGGSVTILVAAGSAADAAGNQNTASNTLGLTYDATAPTGYSASFDQTALNSTNQNALSFTFSGAEVGATYSYTLSSSGGGTPVTGSGTISTATDQITGIDVSGLSDGTLTLSVTLTDTVGNTDTPVTATATKDTTAPAVSLSAPVGSSVSVSTSDIVLEFGETVTAASGKTITISTGTTDYIYTIASTDAYVSGTDASCIATIPFNKFYNSSKPLTLLSGTKYTVSISDGAYVDSAGNGNSAVEAGSFTTVASASSSSSSPSTPGNTTTSNTSDGVTTIATTVAPTTGSDGVADATITSNQLASAISAAEDAAENNGTSAALEIAVDADDDADGVTLTLSQKNFKTIEDSEITSFTVSAPLASVTFDAAALAAIGGASGDVVVSIEKADTSSFSDADKALIGDHPVYDFTVTVGGTTISDFGGGTATVNIPYTIANGEDPNEIVIYYISDSGELIAVPNCVYDAATGAVTFTTTHFSTYAVAYNHVSFSDVAEDAWYANAVTFLAAREITGGTSADTFSPDATLTRGQFITLVMRAYGIAADENPKDNFTDAGDTYYTGYLAAAKRLGISSGIGDNKFAPEQAITRQEMFTLLYNALKAIEQLPEKDSGKALSDFTDSQSISSYAQEAMAYLAKTGVVGGNNGQLSPTNTTTRAQMAQVLYNLLSK